MDKVCINCKWFYNATCNCKEVKQNINIETNNNGITYIEDGILAEAIRENFDFKELKQLFIDKLKEHDYLKKTKNIKEFNIEDLENDIVEMIDNSLSRSIMNYFDGISNLKINISDSSNFSCCYWE